MKIALKRLVLGVTSAGILALYGCGGGGSSATGGGVGATVDVPITVIDGPIHKAMVCLDKNNNGACDTGEPSGSTDVDGKVTLKVDAADSGKFPVISIIEAGVAIDADTGPVATSFTMVAPADKPSVITPLTTLVHNHMESNPGTTSTVAADAVKTATGITISPFADFSKGKTDADKAAANVARMVVVTTQEQSTALKGSVDDDGVTITKETLDKAIQKRLLAVLPQLIALLNDPGVQAALKSAQDKIDTASGDAKLAAQKEKDANFKAPAAKVVTDNGLTKDAVSAVVATAGFGIRNLDYTDNKNYFVRTSVNTVAQGTPDAKGLTRYTDQRYRSTEGVIATWSVGSKPEFQGRLHFNGTAWVNCPINFENTSTARDANGTSKYDWCDKRSTGESKRETVDIAEKTMVSVLKQARLDGYTNLVIGDNSDATLNAKLGDTKFPAGAKLFKQTNTDKTTAVIYDFGSDRTVKLETSARCADVYTEANAANLEAMITKFSGKDACIGNLKTVQTSTGTINSGARNESWGSTVASLGNIGTAPANFTDGPTGTATSYYTTNTRLRVGFGAKSGDGGTTTYYSCKQRYNGSTRNCDVIGTGTYTIATMGDARILTFGNLPTESVSMPEETVYVERAGKVYYGYKDKITNIYTGAGLNMTASKALMTQLAIPLVIDPTAPLALTAASYQGTWDAYPDSDPTKLGSTFTFNATGQVADTSSFNFSDVITITSFNAATGAIVWKTTGTNGYISDVTGKLDFLTGTGTASYANNRNESGTAKFVRR